MVLKLNAIQPGSFERVQIPILALRRCMARVAAPAGLRAGTATIVECACPEAEGVDAVALLGSPDVPDGVVVGVPWVSGIGKVCVPLRAAGGAQPKAQEFQLNLLLLGEPV